MHTNQYSTEFLSMHFESLRPVENIGSANISSRPIKLYVFVNQTPFNCLHEKMLIKQVHQRQKRVTLSYRTRHATITNALVKTCF